MNDQVELWAQAVTESTNNNPTPIADIDSSEHENFYAAAIAIVEPVILNEVAADMYYNFLENDSENWASWIKQTFGDDWGRIAKIVAEEGY